MSTTPQQAWEKLKKAIRVQYYIGAPTFKILDDHIGPVPPEKNIAAEKAKAANKAEPKKAAPKAAVKKD